MGKTIQVLIADNSENARAALRALLSTWDEIEIVGEAADGREAVDSVAALRPDVVLIDIQMPVMDGLEATRLIKMQWPEVAVIVLAMYSADRSGALAAGADRFFSKTALPEEWVPSLRAVATGGAP